MKSNDESKLFIDDKELVYKTQSYELSEKSGIAALKSGMHKIKLLYVGPPFRRKLELQVSYEGPNFIKQEIPAGVLFYRND